MKDCEQNVSLFFFLAHERQTYHLYCCTVRLLDSLNITTPRNTRNNVHKYRVSTLHNLILTFHIFTVMVLTINIILNTYNTIFSLLYFCGSISVNNNKEYYKYLKQRTQIQGKHIT